MARERTAKTKMVKERMASTVLTILLVKAKTRMGKAKTRMGKKKTERKELIILRLMAKERTAKGKTARTRTERTRMVKERRRAQITLMEATIR
jgi:hypothetical protein